MSARQLRKDLGIRDDDTVFLFMAKFIDRKRPLDLIAAAAKNHAAGNSHVIFVGDGALLETCRNTISANKLTNVHLVGFKNQSELPAYYAAADALVLPSEYETWGLVVNEAMACGLPCIVSDACGAAADMILEGKTGFTYPMGDVPRLAELMMYMAEHKERSPARWGGTRRPMYKTSPWLRRCPPLKTHCALPALDDPRIHPHLACRRGPAHITGTDVPAGISGERLS